MRSMFAPHVAIADVTPPSAAGVSGCPSTVTLWRTVDPPRLSAVVRENATSIPWPASRRLHRRDRGLLGPVTRHQEAEDQPLADDHLLDVEDPGRHRRQRLAHARGQAGPVAAR